MITAVDSNIVIDVIGQTNPFTAAALVALDQGRVRGALLVCPVVVAETARHFVSPRKMHHTYDAMHFELRPFGWADLHRAGTAWATYCRNTAKPRRRMLADFLVAAHAVIHADALLTRDRGYYANYFPELHLLEP